MSDPTPLRVEEKPCCDDCENPQHELLRTAKRLMTEAQYQRLLRELERINV